MNRIEQAYHDYISAKILPVLTDYLGEEFSPAAILEINDDIVARLRDDYVPIEYEVVVDE